MILFLVALAIIHVIFYGNTLIQYLYLFSTFGCLLYIAIIEELFSDRAVFILIFFSLLSVSMSMVFNGGTGSALIFMNILLTMIVFSNMQIQVSTYRRIYLMIAVGLSFFLLTMDLSYLHLASCFTFLGYRINANTFGILILANYYSWICFFSALGKKKIWSELFKLFVLLLSAYYLYKAGCRSALVAIIVFLSFLAFVKHPFSYTWFRKIIIMLLLANVILVLGSIYLGDRVEDFEIMGTAILTGREQIWKEALEYYCKSPLIGAGTKIVFYQSADSGTGSGHNTLISIMYTLGTIPTISYVYMLGRRIKNRQHLPYNRVAQFAFLSSLVLAFFESFYTDPYFFMLYTILLLSVNVKMRGIKNGT